MSLRSLIRMMAVACALPLTLRAQSPVPRIDPSVQSVVSGGRWTSGKATGSLRVIEIAEGWENIRYRVFVQWLEDTEDGARVKTSRELGPVVPDQFSLAHPQLVYQAGKWRVDLKAASRPMEQAERPLSFVVGAPGQVALVDPR
jgi:hypothetical protein